MRKAILLVGFLVGLYLVGRAIVEPFVIDVTDPATYRDDWGGPSWPVCSPSTVDQASWPRSRS